MLIRVKFLSIHCVQLQNSGALYQHLQTSDDNVLKEITIKETKSATINIFHFFYFLFKSFVKVELSYVFTINLFTIAENCTEK